MTHRPAPVRGAGGGLCFGNRLPCWLAALDIELANAIAALEHTKGNKTQAAALLGIARTQLHTRVKRFGLAA